MFSSRLRRLGWLAFVLMWLPFAGIFIGMIGMPDGSYAWSELPPLARYSLAATGALFLLTMLTLPGGLVVSHIVNWRLLKSGERAEAEILEIYETGTTVNQHPVVGFRLRVYPWAGAPSVALTEQAVPRLQIPQIQAGARVDVRYDPKSKRVAIDDALL